MRKLKRRLSMIVIVAFFLGAASLLFHSYTSDSSGGKNKNITDITILENDFHTIPDSMKPWVYYWWLKGNVTKELITRDLEEMKAKGIGGFLLFDSRGFYDGLVPVPLEIKYEFMSAGWREMVKYTMQEATRLGLKMSINLANTGGSLRGPWDMKEDGPKQLIWSSANVSGPSRLSVDLEKPNDKKYFKDVALLAVKLKSSNKYKENKGDNQLNNDWKAVTIEPQGDKVLEGEVLNLTNKMEDGKLIWDVPEGDWRILRFGYYVVGDKGGVDILNSEAVTKYFHLMGSEILKDAGPLAGVTLTHFYNVSWEGDQANWTPGFLNEFKKFRGYDMFRYMPMLTGVYGDDKEEFDRFIRDYLKTISDCFRVNCYRNIGDLCHEKGVKWHSENGGPWLQREHPMYMFKEADQFTFWGEDDMPQGEFWSTGDKLSNIRYTAMAAHIYGRPLVAVEAFVHMDKHWTRYPAMLKPFADSNFINGGNFFIWHTFTASPLEVGKPGYEYWAGTHINPNVTWWNQAGAFMKYLGRCQYMLRKGQFVADVCAYVGDENKPNWGRGEKWNEKSSLVLDKGYTYDLISSGALISRLSVKNGKLVLPDGMSYNLLVVDLENSSIPEEVLKKIIKLANDGAIVVLGQCKPTRTPGLFNYPKCDNEIKRMTELLWPNEGEKWLGKPFGKGKIYAGVDMDKMMKDTGILPDFEGPFEYIHRAGADFDVYFVSGEGKADCTFRVEGKKPEIWDPVTGHTTEAASYKLAADGRTIVPLDLPENGSAFVVFRAKAAKKHFASIDQAKNSEITAKEGGTSSFIFWEGGDYKFTTTGGDTGKISVAVAPSVKIGGSWNVTFVPATGAKAVETVFEKLTLWNENNDPAIKYFSGTAAYSNSFSLTAEQAGCPVRLQLGEVHDILQVWVNGKDMGIVWTAPWSVDITGAIKEGVNELKIEVTNCWANRLIGDAGLPEKDRTTETNVRLVPDRSKFKRGLEAYSAKDSLLPSGLLGPVYIGFGKEQSVSVKD